MKKILDIRFQILRENREIIVTHNTCGKRCGKGREKKRFDCGKVNNFELSPISVSCPQSYPHAFPLALQALIPQSTGSTTITTLINIY